jgi:hypothetical protein
MKKYTLAVVMALLLVSVTAVQAASVGPIYIPGPTNYSCQELADLYSPGSTWTELKFDPNPVGGPGTSEILSTNGGSVTVSNGTEWYFDWSSTFGIDAVFVKDGQDGHHLYIYDAYGDPNTESLGDTALVPPGNNAISHISFCYDYELDVSKTAVGSYDRTHTWDIEKSVDPTSQYGFPGDILGWTWTVDLGETYEDSNFAVNGEITIVNPAPIDVDFSVEDVIDGSIDANVDCGDGSSSGTVDANSQVICSYSATDGIDGTQSSNTATVTSQTPGVEGDAATKSITWSATVYNGTADVDDDQESDFPLTVNAGDGTWQWTETQSHTCSSSRSDYGSDGMYDDTVYNTATVTGSDSQTDSAKANTTYTCYASFVDILKTTNGSVDPTKDIRFKLYDSTGADLNDEVSTLNDADGRLGFATALVPGDSYTICEAPVPAGYTFEITVDGGNVLTYPGPPGATNPTGEIQCFDFVAADSPTTLLFEVNNSFPGGAPRTPGYWKNWSKCSGGNQEATAEHLGGVAEGVFLLDDLLPQTVGDLEVTTCEVGVRILDARDIGNNKNRANDAAYTLARSYLAALLNQDAGACDPDGLTFDVAGVGSDLTFQEVLNAAQALLEDQGFDGSGGYLGPKDKSGDREIALALYEIIDDYNNSELCTGDPSH